MTEWTIFCAKNIFFRRPCIAFIHEYGVGRAECVRLETERPSEAF